MATLKYQHPCSILLSTGVQQTLCIRPQRLTHYAPRISTRVLRELRVYKNHFPLLSLRNSRSSPGHKGLFTILPFPLSHFRFFHPTLHWQEGRLAHLCQFQSQWHFPSLGMTRSTVTWHRLSSRGSPHRVPFEPRAGAFPLGPLLPVLQNPEASTPPAASVLVLSVFDE